MKPEEMPSAPVLETQRLTLRGFHPADSDMYLQAAQRNREHLKRYESGNYLMSIHNEIDSKRVVQDLIDGWEKRQYFFLAIFEKQTRDFVGQVYIGPKNWQLPEFMIGYIADVTYEGKGYLSEAVKTVIGWLFNSIGAQRLSLLCDETNSRSIHLAERNGFVREGLIRKNHINPDGSITGSFLYGLLREEWRG